MEMLTNYPWNGNVRELANFIERAVIVTRGEELEVPIANASHLFRHGCCCWLDLYFQTSGIECNHRSITSCGGTNCRQGRSRRTARIETYDPAEQNSPTRHHESSISELANLDHLYLFNGMKRSSICRLRQCGDSTPIR